MPNEIFLQAVKQLAEKRLDAMELIGSAEALSGAGRLDQAIQLYQLWINCNPAAPLRNVAHFNLSVLLSTAGDTAAAREALEQSLTASPDFHPARLNLGVLCANAGELPAALAHWTAVVDQLEPVNPVNLRYKRMALHHLAYHLEQTLRFAEAEEALRKSLELDAHQTEAAQHWVSLRQEQCTWPLLAPLPDGLDRANLMRQMLPLSLAAYTDDAVLQLATASTYSQTFKPASSALSFDRAPATEPTGRRRRIGYLSSDLRSHAVGYLLPEVFELHDRDAFEIFAYYCGPLGPDPLSVRLKGHIEHWGDVTGLSDEAAARRIADDGIDILVDLNGYTRDARTGVVAMRPAPVIVNWLGYPGTMGSPYHHYVIADDWIAPPDLEVCYSEKVLRLPCYQPNDRKRTAIPVPSSRAEYGLPNDATVFCCFNSAHKITRFTFDRWLQILHAVPDSVLWLFETSPATSNRLLAYATQHGVAPERLVFAGKLRNQAHLARYHLADLFLDTAPYGAHTTGSDALWVGLPVLTLSGQSFASRVCGSLVRAAGLPELVCTTPEQYVERAVALGNDRAELHRLRGRLAAQRESCVLFDMPLLVRSLEGLYRGMWEDARQGRLPVPDLANLAVYLDVGSEEDFDRTDVLAIPDLRAWYREKLARRHRVEPIPEDRRLWTHAGRPA